MSKEYFSKAPEDYTPADREGLIRDGLIGSALVMITANKPSDTKNIPGLSLRGDGGYIAVAEATTTSKQGTGFFAKTTTTIAPKLLEQVAIKTNGETHYYRKVHGTDGDKSPTGFKATAWVETDKAGNDLLRDGKKELLLTYSGYTGVPTDGTPQTKSMFAVGDGVLYPQTVEVKAFQDEAIQKAGGKGQIVSISNYSHSMGAANATLSQFAAQMQGIPSTSLQLEPVGASLAVEKITLALRDPKHDLHQQFIANGAISPEEAGTQLALNAGPASDKTISIESRRAEGPVLHTSRSGALLADVPRDVNYSISLSGKRPDGTIATDTAAQKPTDGNAATGKPFYIAMNNPPAAGTDPIHALLNLNKGLRDGRALVAQEAVITVGVGLGESIGSALKNHSTQPLKDFAATLWNDIVQTADPNTPKNSGIGQPAAGRGLKDAVPPR